MDKPTTPPFVSTDVEYISVTKMRWLDSEALHGLRKPLLVLAQGENQPVAVVIGFEQYVTLQAAVQAYFLAQMPIEALSKVG